MKKNIIILLLLIILFNSCKSLVIQKVYNNIQVIDTDKSTYYIDNNINSEKLIIYIEGSGLNSVLGIKENDRWISGSFSFFIIKHFSEEYNILIPEKLNMEYGLDYKNNGDILTHYTVEDLVLSYSLSINHYLNNSQYKTIYMIGCSEGGLLLPAIYNNLENKNLISKLTIVGAGGLSQYEDFKILGTSEVDMPEAYRQNCLNIDKIKDEIDAYPNSIDKYYLGWPYKRWSSFFKYQPINELIKIDLPVLFVQGNQDWSSPVESVKYIEDNYNNDNYTFMYYENMGHFPKMKRDIINMLQEINNWLQEY